MFKGKDLLLVAALGLALGFGSVVKAQTAVVQSPQQDGSGRNRVFVFTGGRLGVRVEPRQQDGEKGVRVREVVKGSAAERAGLKAGDLIVELDGQQIDSLQDLRNKLNQIEHDKTVALRVSRDGAIQQLSVTLPKRNNDLANIYGYGYRANDEELKRALDQVRRALAQSKDERKKALEDARRALEKSQEERKEALAKAHAALQDQLKDLKANQGKIEGNVYRSLFGRGRLGVMVEELSEQLHQYFGVEKGQGVLVGSVMENSAAAKAGIKAGDVIIEVNGKSVANGFDLHRELNKVDAGEVRLVLIREHQRLELRPVLEPRGTAPVELNFVTPNFNPEIPTYNFDLPEWSEFKAIPNFDMPKFEFAPNSFQFNFSDLDDFDFEL